jgi:hypothetical protein
LRPLRRTITHDLGTRSLRQNRSKSPCHVHAHPRHRRKLLARVPRPWQVYISFCGCSGALHHTAGLPGGGCAHKASPLPQRLPFEGTSSAYHALPQVSTVRPG